MAAMLAGFREATGDAIVNISADLQYPVGLLPQMIEKWKSGAEIVICHRKDRWTPSAASYFLGSPTACRECRSHKFLLAALTLCL